MLRAKLWLAAAAAEGRRATEQNLAAFDLKTCRAQCPQGAAAEGLWGLSPAVPQLRPICLCAMLSMIQRGGQEGPFAVLTELPYFSAVANHQPNIVQFIYDAACSLDMQDRVDVQ